MKLKNILTATAITLVAASSQATAQDWAKELSSPKLGKFPKLKPIQLTYQAKFDNAINAGKISFIFDKPDKRYPNYYICQAYGGSALNLLPYNFSTTTFASRKTLLPKLVIINEKDRKESDDIVNKYSTRSVTSKKTTKKIGAKTGQTFNHTFKASYTHDFLSAMLYLRSQKLANGDTYKLAVHPFSSPYLTTVKVLGREKYLGKNCIKLDVSLRKINKKSLALESYKKVQNATIWITDDADRIPLEFKLKVKVSKLNLTIGSVHLTLVAKQKP